MGTHHKHHRVLGIDPSVRGFGFAVVDLAGRVIDRGVARVPGLDTGVLLARAERLIARYSPVALAVEDCTNIRRSERALQFIDRLVGHAHLHEIKPVYCSAKEVRTLLKLPVAATKHEIACELAALMPELVYLLPPRRRPWQSEHDAMNVFDAAGLALVASFVHLAGS